MPLGLVSPVVLRPVLRLGLRGLERAHFYYAGLPAGARPPPVWLVLWAQPREPLRAPLRGQPWKQPQTQKEEQPLVLEPVSEPGQWSVPERAELPALDRVWTPTLPPKRRLKERGLIPALSQTAENPATHSIANIVA